MTMTPAGLRHLQPRWFDAMLAGDAREEDIVHAAAHAAWCSTCAPMVLGEQAMNAVLNRALRLSRDATLTVDTPIGPLTLVATRHAVRQVQFGARSESPRATEHPVLVQAQRELREYFAGERVQFDVPLDLEGLGSFHRDVLRATVEVPCGAVRTYSALAQQLGRPRAARAVGGALHRNPVPILIPCHRVVGSSGALTGYAGGLAAKRTLLALEGAAAA